MSQTKLWNKERQLRYSTIHKVTTPKSSLQRRLIWNIQTKLPRAKKVSVWLPSSINLSLQH